MTDRLVECNVGGHAATRIVRPFLDVDGGEYAVCDDDAHLPVGPESISEVERITAMNVKIDLGNVDWVELRRQKRWLAEHVRDDDNEPVEGLLSFLDHIQDRAAEVLGEETVFGSRPPAARTRRTRKARIAKGTTPE